MIQYNIYTGIKCAGKRDLHMWQKRPTYVAKETYICGKRDLHIHRDQVRAASARKPRRVLHAAHHLQVSFATYAGLFCHIHRSFLPHTQVSFVVYVGVLPHL